MIKLPDTFKDRMKTLLGEEYNAFIDALNDEAVKGFRVNTDKISVADFEKINIFGSEKIPYVHNGYYLDYNKAGNHPYHHAGMIYIQDPSAMASACCLDVEDDWKILDMCAAPGGKSTQLKNMLSENGVLVSNEIIPSRCKVLTGNIERLGLKNCITTCMDTARLAHTFGKTFDMIMVDAPCSGEGMFRKEISAIEEWSQENVLSCAKRQAEILDNAVKCLKDGGYIVYSTCTYSLEENEMTVDAFLKRHSDFALERVNKAVEEHSENGVVFDGCDNQDITFCRRFYPHKNRGEGQFVALLKNCKEKIAEKPRQKEKVKINPCVTEFLENTLKNFDEKELTMYGDTPVIYSGDISVKKGTAFLCGVTIGEIKKNYILPHHQFFMSMGKSFKNIIELESDSDKLNKYLHGEEFYTDVPNGWAVVTVNGCTVGGVKVSNGTAKNHYPKGLRLKY